MPAFKELTRKTIVLGMKFDIQLQKSQDTQGRRRKISGLERLPDFDLQTPNVFIYTQGGLVPHITPQVFKMITSHPQVLMFPLGGITQLQSRLKSENNSFDLATFVGMPEHASYCSVIDPCHPRLQGFHHTNYLSVKTRQGKMEFNPDSFMDFMDILKPDILMALTDGDTDQKSTAKRVLKASRRSAMMFERCYSRRDKKETLFAGLQGGYDLKERANFTELLARQFNLSGVVVDGLTVYGTDTLLLKTEDILDCVESSLEGIPESAIRILHGAWQPKVILDMVDKGIDMFDTSYANLATEKGCALMLSQYAPDEALLEPENTERFEPINKDCKCVTCKNHTRAYIHHLLSVKEMLASVLLQIHNLHEFLEFFAQIRHHLDQGTFQQFRNRFHL